MTDIVERLRCKGGAWINGLYDNEAADEIERLRAERDALRDLLAECRIALMWPGEPAQEFLDRIDAAMASSPTAKAAD